jgi:hypothetical protein
MLDRKTREDLLMRLARLGVSDHHALKLARYASRLDTLNVALCNGDWPCDNGERKTRECSDCKLGYAPSTLLKGGVCPDCRTQDLVRAVCSEAGLTVEFAGDPRGMPFQVERAGEAVSK